MVKRDKQINEYGMRCALFRNIDKRVNNTDKDISTN